MFDSSLIHSLYSIVYYKARDAVFKNYLFFAKKEQDEHSIERFILLFLFIFYGSIIYGTDESELILQPHFHFRY
ncbi:hypothetical protein EWU24_10495 [Enterococcus faecium]|nr:hypothetical protein EWU24_10495 [Enterococcus faecium]